VPLSHHLREEAIIGFLAHLDPAGARAAGVVETPDDMLCLRLDQREVGRPDKAVRSEYGEEVRESGDAHSLGGLPAVVMPEPAQGSGPDDRLCQHVAPSLKSRCQDRHIDLVAVTVDSRYTCIPTAR
jgi:hypothetical protein